MKIRIGFVGNSSSSSFIIRNNTLYPKTLLDFATENLWLVDTYNREYIGNKNKEDVLAGAKNNQYVFPPGKCIEYSFGDEDGTIIGEIYDYVLRDGGKSESFSWEMIECRGDEYPRTLWDIYVRKPIKRTLPDI